MHYKCLWLIVYIEGPLSMITIMCVSCDVHMVVKFCTISTVSSLKLVLLKLV